VNVIDVGIVVVIGLGVLIGWRQGLLAPLLAEGTFLLSYWFVSRHPTLAALVPSAIPRPYAVILLPAALALVIGFVGRAVIGTVFRLPLTRSADRLAGAAANGVVAFGIVYAVLLGLTGAATVLDPLLAARSLQPTQITAMQMLLAQNPQATGFVPSAELQQLASVAKVQPLPLTALGQYAQVITYYQQTLRPQLTSSALAPFVLRVGKHIPVIGRAATIPST
jgi:uncharacterized membrane protein required for colicin V production